MISRHLDGTESYLVRWFWFTLLVRLYWHKLHIKNFGASLHGDNLQVGVFAILWVEKFVEEGRIRTMGITHSPAQRYDELIANCD